MSTPILGNIPQNHWQSKGGNRFVRTGVNVGIGQENPLTSLHIGNGLQNEIIHLDKGAGSSSGVQIFSGGVLAGMLTLDNLENMTFGLAANSAINILTNNILRAHIKSGGQIEISNDLYFVGGDKGFIISAFGQDDVPTTVTIPGANTDVIIDGMTEMFSNLMTFQNNQESKVDKKGRYGVIWGISVEVSAANKEVEGAVGLNGVRQGLTAGHRTISGSSNTGHLGGCGIIDCAVNDLLQIVVRNETDATDIIVQHANILMVQFVGT